MKPGQPSLSLEQALNLSGAASAALYRKHVNPPLAGLLKLAGIDLRYSRADGVYLYDPAGRPFLDLTAGYGALNLGHNPGEVLEAVRAAQRLPSVLLAGVPPLAGALGAALADVLPGRLAVSIFGSGGAEAVEHALKTARAATGRGKFLSCEGGYHGLSFGALSVCGSKPFREPVAPLLGGCELVPFGDLEALGRALRGREFAAFIVEPIQGEGGFVVPPAGYLRGAAALCRTYRTLLVFDEIQTGFGRTGAMFAMEHEGVVPDIVTLSKSLGSGVVPVSASVATERVWKRAFGSHDRFDLAISTFGGNPAACAAALKTVEIMRRDGIPARARELGDYARARLEELKEQHKLVRGIRGRGLMLGIELETSALVGKRLKQDLVAEIISELLNRHGVLTSYCDLDPRVLRFEPPLIIAREQIDAAVDALDEVLAKRKTTLLVSLGVSALRRLAGRPEGSGNRPTGRRAGKRTES